MFLLSLAHQLLIGDICGHLGKREDQRTEVYQYA
jgi:hypothetical protein